MLEELRLLAQESRSYRLVVGLVRHCDRLVTGEHLQSWQCCVSEALNDAQTTTFHILPT